MTTIKMAAKSIKNAAMKNRHSFLVAFAFSLLIVPLVGWNWFSTAIVLVAWSVAFYQFAGALCGAVTGWFSRVSPAQTFCELDSAVAQRFKDPNRVVRDDYDFLVSYFASGVNAYRSSGHAHVVYPGLPGTYGLQVEGLEGFARTAPLLASWVNARGDIIRLSDGCQFNIRQHLLKGLSNGTDPNSDEYWGDIGNFDQRMVEAGDVAITVWMMKRYILEELREKDKENVIAWLKKTEGEKIYGGNWHLFPIVAGLVLGSLGEVVPESIYEHYKFIKKMHLGNGWFNEGYKGRVDHYNAWQFCYFLYFLDQIDPKLDHVFISTSINQFATLYQYWFTPNGFPISGRSVCYRMAVPTPLILSAGAPGSDITLGKARRALDVIWSHFINRDSVKFGNVSQGYQGVQPELLENYSGRGSCLWSLRSLPLLTGLAVSARFGRPPQTAGYRKGPLQCEFARSPHKGYRRAQWNSLGFVRQQRGQRAFDTTKAQRLAEDLTISFSTTVAPG